MIRWLYSSALCLLLTLPTIGTAQPSLLQAGPMVGYSTMREVMLWVQTNAPAEVQISYWVEGTPSEYKFTNKVLTDHTTAYTAHLIADQVNPGETYNYRLLINGQAAEFDYPTEFTTQQLWQWRTDPPNFKMALGSCTYINEPAYDRPGEGYGGDYQIFESIRQQDPDLMLWLGDNIYLREADWYSNTGILQRYTHTRSVREMQPLLASTSNYAIWDDHDFGPNDSDRSFIHKDKTLEAFQLFWANPSYGLPGMQGITTQFQWADCDFFLLDNRYFRSPNNRRTTDVTMLGEEQLQWVVDALSSSRASFKFILIGGQVLNTAGVYENFSNQHAEERAVLLKRIEEEGIKNVIFLTGDRHHTELSMMETRTGIPIYDFTVSPLTSGAAKNVTETNAFRLEGTLVTQRNFGLIEVSGPRKERILTFEIRDSNGNQLWQRSITMTP